MIGSNANLSPTRIFCFSSSANISQTSAFRNSDSFLSFLNSLIANATLGDKFGVPLISVSLNIANFSAVARNKHRPSTFPYKDGRIDRDLYKQRAEKISVQLEKIKRKIEDAENSKKLLEQNELSDKIKLKDFLGIQKFDTEKLREIIKVIRVHSQDEIEIEWNFDDIFSEQR